VNSNFKNISRVKTGNTDGWQVRVSRNGIKHTKFFSIKRFGSEDLALTSAQQYRNSLLSISPAPNAGTIKMGRDDGITLYKTGTYRAWMAQWVDGNGKRCNRKFNIKTHGNLRAKQLARKARQMGVARLNQPKPAPAPMKLKELCK